MIRLIKQKLGLKIALLTNLCIFIITVICVGIQFFQISGQFDTHLAEKGKNASTIGAKSIGRILEEAVDNGVLNLSDLFDTNYEEMVGFDPPKYHTKYDRYTDKALLVLQDEFLNIPDILYAASTDINGYLPTHNTRYSKAITGDKDKNLKGNRTKRIYKDEIAVKACQNKTPGFIQKYYRDTGQVVWDISSPIFVKGKHWGCFRVGFELDQIADAKKKLLFNQAGLVVTILLFSMLSVFFLINSRLKPLERFSQVASDLADGKLDEKIQWHSQDEIGNLADVLERLRLSLKAAMKRLSN